MDFESPEELAEVQKLPRDFSEKEIAASAAMDDKEHIFRKDLVTKMGSLGFFGCLIPEEYGGNGLGFLAYALISEEIARVMIHVAYSALFSQTTLTNLLL
jgi:glutaryl-CoA dehydrogenase (non-decarboxylating)